MRPSEDEESQLLRGVVEGLSEAVCVVGLDDRIVYTNQAFRALYGYAEGELTGRPMEWLAGSCQSAPAWDAIRRGALEGGWRGELWNRHRAGREFQVRLSVTPARDGSGRAVALACVATDLTESQRTEEARLRHLDTLTRIREVSEELASLPSVEDLYGYVARTLKLLTGAMAVGVVEYRREERRLVVRRLESDPGLLAMAARVLGIGVREIITQVDEAAYQEIVSARVAFRESMTEITFGAVPAPVGRLLNLVLGIRHYVALAYVYQGELFGTSVMAFPRGAPLPSVTFLDAFASLVAVSLRRHRAEERTRISEERFRSMFENAAVGIYRTTPDGRILAVNSTLLQMLGFQSFEELAARNLEQEGYEPGYPRSEFKRLIERDGEVRGLESSWTRRDGTSIYVREHARVQRDGDGNPLYYEGTVEDISGYKQAEAALRESENRLRGIVENLPGLVFQFYARPGGEVGLHYAGESAEKVLGLSVEPLADAFQRFTASIVPEDRDRFLASVAEAVASRSAWEFSGRLVKPAGGVVWFKAVSRPRQVGEELIYDGLLLDVTAERLAEQALQEHRDRINAIVEKSHDLIWEVDAQGRYTYCNPALEKILGYRLEDIACLGLDLVHPEDRPRVEAVWAKCTAERTGWTNVEARWRAKDGGYRYLESNAVPISGPGGALLGFRGVDRDITRRRRAEEALRQSEAKYRLIIENTSDVIVAVSRDGIVRYVSPNIRRWGYDPEQVTGRPATEYVHPDDFEAGFRDVPAPLPGGTVTTRWRLRTAAGNYLHIEAVTRAVKDGPHAGMLTSVLRDITERRKAEEEIAGWKTRYDRLSLAFGHVVYDCSSTTGKVAWGGSLEKILGYEPGELDGGFRQWEELIHPEEREEIARRFAAATAQAAVFQAEYRFRHKNGRYVLVQDTGYPLSGEAGNVESYVGVMVDVTERRRAEAERARLEEQLQQAQKMESIGRLAGGIAHDFNNLLTVINGYTSLLLSKLRPADPMRAQLEEIRKSGERAADLTRQLLAFSRRQVVEPKPVHLNRLIADSRNMLGRMVGELIEIVTELAPGAGQVMADPGQLHQILLNLVVNARDAMPEGGLLTIRTSRLVLGAEAAGAHPDVPPGSYVLLTVSDTGAGMSEEVRRRVFEPFFTTKEEGKGTGLGLSTVYGIVKQAGGWIEVESEPGKGTVFRVGLPLWTGDDSQTTLSSPHPGRQQGSETILVVEDQDEVRRFTVEVLQSCRYDTLVAGSGAEALSLAESYPGPIHLLLTDVVMAKMTGKQLAERMARLRPEIRVLYMSGYSRDVIAHQGLLEPGVHYIQKPFRVDELAEKVKSVLR